MRDCQRWAEVGRRLGVSAGLMLLVLAAIGLGLARSAAGPGTAPAPDGRVSPDRPADLPRSDTKLTREQRERLLRRIQELNLRTMRRGRKSRE
jgi:hypothetical protein